jgi:cell division protease FtsH
MSGADLANVINEAALLTARENGTLITNAALEESVDRVVGGPARKGRVISETEKKITAYHEGGHALAAWAMPGLEPVYKVTILPRGRTGGHALVVPEDDKQLMTRTEMINRLVMSMGGRAAEELVFAEPTTGASSDIAQATKIAKAMVTEYGMSAKLGAVKYGTGDDEPFLGRTYGHSQDYSAEVSAEIDHAARALIETAHTEAYEVLNTYRDVLDTLAGALLDKETLEQRDLEAIFADVEKRPRITVFDEWGDRLPSDLPPIKTPRELAIERGEPLPEDPPKPRLTKSPVPVGVEPGRPGEALQPNGYQQGGHPQGGQYPGFAGRQDPPNWTGGVLPGPLGPPSWGGQQGGGQNGGGQNSGYPAPNGAPRPTGYPVGQYGPTGPNGGHPNGPNGGHQNGPNGGHQNGGAPNGYQGNGVHPDNPGTGAHRRPDHEPPADPWAPPGEHR